MSTTMAGAGLWPGPWVWSSSWSTGQCRRPISLHRLMKKAKSPRPSLPRQEDVFELKAMFSLGFLFLFGKSSWLSWCFWNNYHRCLKGHGIAVEMLGGCPKVVLQKTDLTWKSNNSGRGSRLQWAGDLSRVNSRGGLHCQHNEWWHQLVAMKFPQLSFWWVLVDGVSRSCQKHGVSGQVEYQAKNPKSVCVVWPLHHSQIPFCAPCPVLFAALHPALPSFSSRDWTLQCTAHCRVGQDLRLRGAELKARCDC